MASFLKLILLGVIFQFWSGGCIEPPTLAHSFLAEYSWIVAENDFDVKEGASLFSGTFASDFALDPLAGMLTIQSDKGMPIEFHTTVIVSANTTEYMMTSPDACVGGDPFLGFFILETLKDILSQIPSNASFVGYFDVNGFNCSTWNFTSLYQEPVQAAVTIKEPHVVMYYMMGYEGNYVKWLFSNYREVNNLNPKQYAPPPYCHNPFWPNYFKKQTISVLQELVFNAVVP